MALVAIASHTSASPGLAFARLTSFQFKRARAHIKRMALGPENLAESLDLIANAPPGDAADELRRLAAETKAIVRAEMPDVDVDRPWRPDL